MQKPEKKKQRVKKKKCKERENLGATFHLLFHNTDADFDFLCNLLHDLLLLTE